MNLYESIKTNLNEEEKLPELPEPYYFHKGKDGKLYISSSHPYDLSNYSFAYCKYPHEDKGQLYGLFEVNFPHDNYKNRYTNFQNTKPILAEGYEEALEVMKEIDKDIPTRIDRT